MTIVTARPRRRHWLRAIVAAGAMLAASLAAASCTSDGNRAGQSGASGSTATTEQPLEIPRCKTDAVSSDILELTDDAYVAATPEGAVRRTLGADLKIGPVSTSSEFSGAVVRATPPTSSYVESYVVTVQRGKNGQWAVTEVDRCIADRPLTVSGVPPAR